MQTILFVIKKSIMKKNTSKSIWYIDIVFDE